jgi:FkbM family methyltransferase
VNPLQAGLFRRRIAKAARLALTPAYWGALRRGVAATTEHRAVDFRPDVETVVDVGASRGQFATFALHRFPNAGLICFEPLHDASEVLERVLPNDRATIHRLALGAEAASLELHVAAQDDSSSLLPIGPRQVGAFPGTEERRRERVDVACLEEFLTADLRPPILLKVDVQGYELAVLQGAGPSLALVEEIFVECSFVELYTGQALADAVICFLREAGLRLAGVFGVVEAPSGTCLQADLLFRRDDER